LNPSKIGVAARRHSVFPTDILFQVLATPVTHVEWRIGQDEVRPKVLVQIISHGPVNTALAVILVKDRFTARDFRSLICSISTKEHCSAL
jgi:hypothetical protein